MSKFTKTIAGVVSGLALVATVAGVASAATFTSNLTVGSTGSQVTELQMWLVSKGYLVMPTGVAYGYFGGLTRSAVAAYQTAKGITPPAGYFGPVTRAAVNAEAAMGTGSTVPGCTPGAAYSSLTGQPCTGGTPAPVGGVTMDGTDGSITVSYSPYVTTSQTIKKGETKDIYSVKLKATSGKVGVTRFDVHFSERPWLVFTQLQLRDSNGNVIATKALTSAADVTEVTVGSDYLVRFEGFSYTVDPSVEATLIVSATVSSASDKITGQTVTVTVPTGSIRTINGRGYTDSLGISNSNSVTLSSTGSTGDIYTRVSPNTPDRRIVTTSVSQVTPDVVLGVFSLKSQNQSATVNSLDFNINNSAAGATSTYFQNVRLKVGGQVYGANSLSAGSDTFTNLSLSLPQDVWTDVTLVADVLANISGVSASSTLVAAGIVGVDTNYNTLTVSNASNGTANDITLQTSGISVSNMSASYTLTTGGANGNTTGAAVTFTFTVTNTGNSDVYISKVPAVALATSTTGSTGSPASASSTITYVTASPSTYAADTGTAPSSGAYVVPAGASRTLTYSGSLDNTNGTAGIRVFKITTINFGTSAGTPTGSSVNFNLDPLTVTPNLAAN
jgi:hypothetical protein